MKTILILVVIFVGVVVSRSFPENYRFKKTLNHKSTVSLFRFKRGYYDFETGRYRETIIPTEKIGLVIDRNRIESNQYNYNRGDYSPGKYNTGGHPAQSSFKESPDYGRRNRNNNRMGKYDPANREYLSSYTP